MEKITGIFSSLLLPGTEDYEISKSALEICRKDGNYVFHVFKVLNDTKNRDVRVFAAMEISRIILNDEQIGLNVDFIANILLDIFKREKERAILRILCEPMSYFAVKGVVNSADVFISCNPAAIAEFVQCIMKYKDEYDVCPILEHALQKLIEIECFSLAFELIKVFPVLKVDRNTIFKLTYHIKEKLSSGDFESQIEEIFPSLIDLISTTERDVFHTSWERPILSIINELFQVPCFFNEMAYLLEALLSVQGLQTPLDELFTWILHILEEEEVEDSVSRLLATICDVYPHGEIPHAFFSSLSINNESQSYAVSYVLSDLIAYAPRAFTAHWPLIHQIACHMLTVSPTGYEDTAPIFIEFFKANSSNIQAFADEIVPFCQIFIKTRLFSDEDMIPMINSVLSKSSTELITRSGVLEDFLELFLQKVTSSALEFIPTIVALLKRIDSPTYTLLFLDTFKDLLSFVHGSDSCHFSTLESAITTCTDLISPKYTEPKSPQTMQFT